MEASSSSKITVEYHDPAGVFPLISSDIANRLPLRNLNWQTPSRPLRQIKSLHVEFVPDNYTQGTLRPQQNQRLDSNGANSFDIARGGNDPHKSSVTERRHQIPGLKTSPYLKLYVLRCDDKDTYKATERKRLREWIKENVQAEGKRENHDACEWLILHVVIPDTVAASEPRWRESQSEANELRERKGGPKFPGKSTRTVFDKLRADFNESSKSSPDRVAQIRRLKNQVPADLLPTPAQAATLRETAQERENAWQDLMTKLKNLILTPFDLRVRQYESDIAEQEARRSLPGWNFCTFFIHKEGLAKALESIGLVEDALVIYDELSLGLETVLRDMASGQANGTATSFAVYTDDIKERIVGGKNNANGTGRNVRHGQALGLFDIDYRDRIVRSQISVFDFFCYLFSRQKALILRLAGALSARSELGSNYKEGGEDLVLLAEVCWRALSFLPNAARTLRQDLANGFQSVESRESQLNIESLVSSWTYSVAGQVLAETYSILLEPTNASDTSRASVPNGSPRRDAFAFGLGADPYPQRNSSLLARKSAPDLKSPPPSGPYQQAPFSPPSSSGTDVAKVQEVKPGIPELVAYRAEMVMMRRKMLELLAGRRGWFAGWAAVRRARPSRLQEVSFDDEAVNTEQHRDNGDTAEYQPSRLLCPPLAAALETEATFQKLYEDISEVAIKHYMSATHTKTAETVFGDLAMLKRQQGDIASAVIYFQHVLPLYATDGWSLVEAEALSYNAQCLRELGRKEEYVSTLLTLLAKNCGRKMERKLPSVRLTEYVEEDNFDARCLLQDVIAYSEALAKEITLPMTSYFDDIQLDHHIGHYDDRDGFKYKIRFRHVLEDEVDLDQVSVRLVCANDRNQEIWLVCGMVELRPGLVEVELETTATTYGPYLVDRLVLKARRLRFAHNLQPASTAEQTPLGIITIGEPDKASSNSKYPWLLLYPAEHAFDVQMTLQSSIHIDKPRHIEVKLRSGWNEVKSIDLRLKPASAGLRLHLADSTFDGIEERHDDEPRARQVSLGGLEAHQECLVKVPYTLEQSTQELAIRLEARYNTVKGSFGFTSSVHLPNELPLDVDVNDIFHHDALFSTFTIRTMRGAPLAITAVNLDDSPAYAVEAPPVLPLPMMVLSNQPGALMYKITRKVATKEKLGKKEGALALSVEYRLMEDQVISHLRGAFAHDLSHSLFRSLVRLLVPVFTERSRSSLTRSQLEMAMLMNEVTVPSFADLGWFEVTDTLPESMQRPLSDWLMQWHLEHKRIDLAANAPSASVSRRIIISVDVPTVDVVFSVALGLHDLEAFVDRHPVVTVGQVIRAQLCIKHTANWSASNIFGTPSIRTLDQAEDQRFVYDIQAESDAWLVGGQRRMHFRLQDEEDIRVDLILIPLKVGHLPLPHVDVQPAATEGSGETPAKEPAVSCETNYESAGLLVHVIRDLRTAKVQIVETPAAPMQHVSQPSESISKDAG